MNIEHFQEFIELARRLNYREAANALCMSQSALSKHIQALERTYGCALFARDRSRVELTTEGALLVEHAQKIVLAYQGSLEAMAAVRQSRPLIVSGVVESPDERETMTKLIAYLSEKNAPRRMRVKGAGNISPDEQFEALANGAIDCFVSYNLGDTPREGINVVHLCNTPLDIIVSRDSALAAKDSLSVSDLLGATFIHLAGPNFTPIWRQIEALLDELGVPHLVKAIPTDSVYDYMDPDLGNCVLAMPRKALLLNAERPERTKMVPVNDPCFKLRIDAAYCEAREDESLRCLLEGLQACYRSAEE